MTFLTFTKSMVLSIAMLSINTQLYGWSGRAVPVSFNKNTQEWNILLGHDKNGYWSDFSLSGNKGDRGDTLAQGALSYQTNGFYNLGVTGSPWAKTPTGDIVHAVKVPYASQSVLRAQASNYVKDDFAWIPLSEFFKYSQVSRPLTNGTWVNVSYGISGMIKTYMPQLTKDLDNQRKAKKQQKTQKTAPQQIAQSQGAQSWFGIPGAVYFYTKGKPYYEFTNFDETYSFHLDGDLWITSEQYYQAQKFVGHPGLYKAIRDFRTDNYGSAAKKAFDFAQSHKASVDPQWNKRSLDVMYKALQAKFVQNSPLAALLKKTGNAVLVEDSPVDAFFGAGKQGTGENHLGKLLMKVRKTL